LPSFCKKIITYAPLANETWSFLVDFFVFQLMDLELEAACRVRARLVFLSPPIWQQSSDNFHNIGFETKKGAIKGTIQESELSVVRLPKVNEACILNLAAPAINVRFNFQHFGPTTPSADLPPLKFEFTPIINVRTLTQDTICSKFFDLLVVYI